MDFQYLNLNSFFSFALIKRREGMCLTLLNVSVRWFEMTCLNLLGWHAYYLKAIASVFGIHGINSRCIELFSLDSICVCMCVCLRL